MAPKAAQQQRLLNVCDDPRSRSIIPSRAGAHRPAAQRLTDAAHREESAPGAGIPRTAFERRAERRSARAFGGAERADRIGIRSADELPDRKSTRLNSSHRT